MTTVPAQPRAGDLALPSFSNQPARATEPLVGVSCRVLSEAARRVAAQVREEAGTDGDMEIVAAVLAAIALAADRGRPRYVSELVPRASPAVSLRLLELLRAEVIRGFQEAPPALATPSQILRTLGALEQVREVIEPDTARQLASQLAGAKGLDLLVEIAHDLRSPLTSILFLSETLQHGQSGEVNEMQRRQLGLVYSAALGLSSLVSDAIELVHGGDRLVDDLPCPFSVGQTLEAVRDMVRPMAEEKGLSVRILPPAGDHRLGHSVALSRVLLNLTCNAIKFTEQGFVEVVAQARTGSLVEFSVRDTGNGIDPQALTRLYQPFRRTTGGRGLTFSGTGLGLSICRKLVEAMGSKLEVETQPGWGTRFHCELDLPPATLA